jgi:hypothetical protein
MWYIFTLSTITPDKAPFSPTKHPNFRMDLQRLYSTISNVEHQLTTFRKHVVGNWKRSWAEHTLPAIGRRKDAKNMVDTKNSMRKTIIHFITLVLLLSWHDWTHNDALNRTRSMVHRVLFISTHIRTLTRNFQSQKCRKWNNTTLLVIRWHLRTHEELNCRLVYHILSRKPL